MRLIYKPIALLVLLCCISYSEESKDKMSMNDVSVYYIPIEYELVVPATVESIGIDGSYYAGAISKESESFKEIIAKIYAAPSGMIDTDDIRIKIDIADKESILIDWMGGVSFRGKTKQLKYCCLLQIEQIIKELFLRDKNLLENDWTSSVCFFCIPMWAELPEALINTNMIERIADGFGRMDVTSDGVREIEAIIENMGCGSYNSSAKFLKIIFPSCKEVYIDKYGGVQVGTKTGRLSRQAVKRIQFILEGTVPLISGEPPEF